MTIDSATSFQPTYRRRRGRRSVERQVYSGGTAELRGVEGRRGEGAGDRQGDVTPARRPDVPHAHHDVHHLALVLAGERDPVDARRHLVDAGRHARRVVRLGDVLPATQRPVRPQLTHRLLMPLYTQTQFNCTSNQAIKSNMTSTMVDKPQPSYNFLNVMKNRRIKDTHTHTRAFNGPLFPGLPR